ncbi:hypothetical protein [Nonomuraea typhae]|uniref:Uncharacterized protein n=1 Tax=Nonomuraea typhae TaxID=2603600 RepID=A0ABW7Z0N2_9ACTN
MSRVGIDPALMTQLIGEIKRLERSWAEADAQLHRALGSIGVSLPGPGLLRDLGFQIAQRVPDLQRRLDLIVAAQKVGLDKGVVWADETLWVSHSAEGGAVVAKTVADQLRQARKDTATVSAQEALDRETLDLLEKHQNDPYFAVALARELPPKELKALLRDFQGADPRALDKASSDVNRLLAALSVTLGTASRGVGNLKLPKGYTDELIATDGSPLSGGIVDQLLRRGVFDDAFLRDLANKVYDNAHKPQHERQEIIGFGPGLAAALAGNARVAQDFFTDPVRKPLAFLMRENSWGSDGGREIGRAIEAAATTYRDHGERGAKSALIASWAVHFWSGQRTQAVLPHTRQNAGRVFAAYIGDVNRLDRRGEQKPGVTPVPDADPALPGRQPPGAVFDYATTKSAMIWAFEDPTALRTVLASQGRYSVMALDAQAARIVKVNQELLDAWRADHPDATKSEVDAQRQRILRDNVSGATSEAFKAGVHALSSTLRFIVDAGNLSEINAADAQDKTRQALKDMALSTVNLALAPAHVWVAGGYEFLEANLGDTIKFEEGKSARERAETALFTSQNLFRDLTADAMVRHGLFGEGPRSDTHPHSSENYAKGTPQDFIKDGEIIPRSSMTPIQEYAYLEWLRSSPASGVFREVDEVVRDGFEPRANPYPKEDE